jgi:hypothetical protein
MALEDDVVGWGVYDEFEEGDKGWTETSGLVSIQKYISIQEKKKIGEQRCHEHISTM